MRDLSRDPESPFFRAWGSTILRFRLLFLLMTIVVTAAGGFFAKGLKQDMAIESFLDSQSEALRVLEEFRDQFGRDDVFMVVVEGDVFSSQYISRLKKLHDELENINLELPTLGERLKDRRPAFAETLSVRDSDTSQKTAGEDEDDFEDEGWGDEEGGTIIDEIVSLINVRQTKGRTIEGPEGPSTEIVVGELMDPLPTEAELSAVKARVLKDNTLVGQVVDKAGKYSVIVLRTQFMAETDSNKVYDHILGIGKKYNQEGFRIVVGGMPALATSLNRLVLREMGTLFGLSMLTLIFVMLFIFRHALGAVIPMLVVFLSVVWTFGVMGLLGFPMTMLTSILPAFIICVGVGDSVHLMSVYRDFRKDGIENQEAITRALATTGKPIFFTSVTTMFGLLSFFFATIDAVGEMGAAGAFGVSCALLHSLVVLPILLSFNKKSLLGAKKGQEEDFIDKFLHFCSGLSGRYFNAPKEEPAIPGRKNKTLLAALVLTSIAIFGASLIKVWHNPLAWIPDDDVTKRSFNIVDENVGGTATIQLLIRTESEHGIKDLKLLQGLEKLIEHIWKYEHFDKQFETKYTVVGNAISVLDVVKETNQALHGGDPNYYKLPETQRALADTMFMFENAGPDQLRRLATADLKQSQLTMRVKWLEATSYGPMTIYIDEGIEKYMKGLAEVKPTGSTYTLLTTVSSLISNVMRSFLAAFVVITLMMILLLKNVRLGLIAMVPNLLPIVVLAGFMGFTNIPIDMSNLMIASISIGLAVDDTIHFLHHFRIHFDTYGKVESAISHAFSHTGRALVGTSMILSIGFGVYLKAEMANLQRFGLLISMTTVLALLIDLIFAPALLRTFYRDKQVSPVGENS